MGYEYHVRYKVTVDTVDFLKDHPDGQVATLVQQLQALHLRQLDGCYQLAALGHPGGGLPEDLEQVPGEDEVSLLPAKEQLVEPDQGPETTPRIL